jgi:hypothetical protein
MIVRNLTIKIQGNRATTDSPLYLHTQDKNIHVVITVMNGKFEIKDSMLLSFTIIKPNGDEVDRAECYIKNKQCHLLLNGEEFDEETEVGTHLVQLKLYDEFRQARLSLPPFAMHILKSNGSYYADDEVEGIQAEQNAYKLMTENRLALEMNQSILISDLPTTTEVNGFVPITQGDTTYKLDMSTVATKEDVATIDLSPYATKEEVNGKADKEHNHNTVYAPMVHEHSQYLTEHQDISHLASKAYVSNAIADAQLSGEGEEIDLSGYATKDDLLTKADKNHNHDTVYALKSELVHNHDNNYAPKKHNHSYNDLTDKPNIPSVDGLATETYVNDAIANAQLGGEDIDLSGYALKTDLPTATSDLTNDSGFITEVPSEYVTDEELNARGYLTQHQDISHLATKEEIPNVDGMVTSQEIVSIKLVDALPTEQETGVLYIVKASE